MSRILAVYLDMLCSEYLNIGNDKFNETSIEKYLKEVGGTFYINCYTPAPDTARSAACMWTGKYPRRNGCDGRYKWPRYFLNDNNDIYTVLKNAGYQIEIFCDYIYYETGLFPPSVVLEDKNYNFKEFLVENKKTENLFTFAYIPDLHHMLAGGGYTVRNYNRACDFSKKVIQEIFETKGERYDYILLFGDHGFIMDDQDADQLCLSGNRTKVGIYIKEKYEREFHIDTKLHSVMDIYPTILDYAGIPYNQDELNAVNLKNGVHSYVLMEDHKHLSDDIGYPISAWQIVTEKGVYWVNEDGKWHSDGTIDAFDQEYWNKLLISEMTNYAEMRKLYETKQRYMKYCFIKRTVYGDTIGFTKAYVFAMIFRGIKKRIQKFKNSIMDNAILLKKIFSNKMEMK